MAMTMDRTERAEALTERLFLASAEAMDLLTVYIGDRLGFYRELAGGDALTTAELAARTQTDERYVREWCEQQTATGILEVDDAAAAPADRHFSLPAGYADSLCDPDSPFSIAPLARAITACAVAMPKLIDAYRTGGGVAWSDFGQDAIEAQGDFNRPWLVAELGGYLRSIPDVAAKLEAGGRVADVACGVGWSAIAVAEAFPAAAVDGFDIDDASIALARQFAGEKGLSDRTAFEVRDGADLPEGSYDLALVIEAIHDMPNPVPVLASIRRSLKPGGTLIVADERTEESFTPNADVPERLFYGFSILCCLPAGMADEGSAATGTVMRPDTFTAYATEAGFAGVEILDIDHPMLRFYRLDA